MSGPIVTAVIPTYRRVGLLRAAVESVLAQTYPHLRVLVCDNASGDGTREMIAELQQGDPRVLYHCHPKNMGGVYNFRYGMEAVETDLFSIMSDDDLLLPHFYRHAVEALKAHRSARFFCGQVVHYDERRGTHGVRPRDSWREGLHEAGASARLMSERHFTWTGIVFHRELRDQLGQLDAAFASDEIYLVSAAAHFPLVVSLVPSAIFRQTGRNNSRLVSMSDLKACRDVMIQRYRDLPNVTEADRGRILEITDRHIDIAANSMLREALEAGEWQRLDEVAAFLESRGALTGRRRLRVALARRSPPTRWLVSRMTRLSTGYKRMRRSGWRRHSLDEIVKLYSGSGAQEPAVTTSQ